MEQNPVSSAQPGGHQSLQRAKQTIARISVGSAADVILDKTGCRASRVRDTRAPAAKAPGLPAGQGAGGLPESLRRLCRPSRRRWEGAAVAVQGGTGRHGRGPSGAPGHPEVLRTSPSEHACRGSTAVVNEPVGVVGMITPWGPSPIPPDHVQGSPRLPGRRLAPVVLRVPSGGRPGSAPARGRGCAAGQTCRSRSVFNPRQQRPGPVCGRGQSSHPA